MMGVITVRQCPQWIEPVNSFTRFILKLLLSMVFIGILLTSCSRAPGKRYHLFILSGQSNMARLDPSKSFIPEIAKEFGKEHVIVVKDAHGGQPIRRWYKKWNPGNGSSFKDPGDLYDRLMEKVQKAIHKKKINTINFIWMQGERDACEGNGKIYASSLVGLVDQLKNDLQNAHLNVVIGRISDYDLENRRCPHWKMIRQAQVTVAESNSRFAWINTDDLNDGLNEEGELIKNDLHYTVEGYEILGRRFAERSIDLIQKISN